MGHWAEIPFLRLHKVFSTICIRTTDSHLTFCIAKKSFQYIIPLFLLYRLDMKVTLNPNVYNNIAVSQTIIWWLNNVEGEGVPEAAIVYHRASGCKIISAFKLWNFSQNWNRYLRTFNTIRKMSKMIMLFVCSKGVGSRALMIDMLRLEFD